MTATGRYFRAAWDRATDVHEVGVPPCRVGGVCHGGGEQGPGAVRAGRVLHLSGTGDELFTLLPLVRRTADAISGEYSGSTPVKGTV